MKKTLRCFFAVVAVIVVLSLFLTSPLEGRDVKHDCIGDGCPVCAVLNACSELEKSMSGSAAAPVFMFILFGIALSVSAGEKRDFTCSSPVKLKVKLLD